MFKTLPPKRSKKRSWPAVTVLNPGKGLNTLVSENMIANEEWSDAKNMMVVEAGSVSKRNGHTAVGTGLVNNPKGMGSFYTTAGSKYALTIDGTALKYLNGSSWTTISGVSFTTAKNTIFTQAKNSMYIWNGTEAGSKLDSSLTLTRPTTTVTAAFAIFYSGRQIASGVSSQPNRIYVSGTDPGDFTNTNPTGTGDYSVFDSTTHPGASAFAGSDANYIDINKDDGDKITGLAKFQSQCIIFKERAIYGMTFDTAGVPVITQLSGSVGCVSHRSIDNVENDTFFLSRQGYYVLGNQPNFFSTVRTNELSAPVHDIIDSITASNLGNTASIYSGYTFYSSISTGGTTTNNKTLTYDRRYQDWSPWLSVNANAFTEYIDSNNTKHLYYAADDEAQVYEIDTSYSDNGTAIDAYVVTKAFDLGDFSLQKQFIDIDLLFRQLSGSVTITIIVDGNTVVSTKTITNQQDLSGTVGSDEWGAYQWGGGTYLTTTTGIAQTSTTSTGTLTTNVPFRIHVNKSARTIKIKVANARNNENFVFLGFKIYYRPYGHETFSTSQIIS